MFNKKVLSVLFAITILTTTASPALANEAPYQPERENIEYSQNNISPRWTYIKFITSSLDISGKTATVEASVTGKLSVDSSSIKITLEKKEGRDWIEYSSWSVSEDSAFAEITKTDTITSGTYRLKTKVTVSESSNTETVTRYSSSVSCS